MVLPLRPKSIAATKTLTARIASDFSHQKGESRHETLSRGDSSLLVLNELSLQ
jgi:hypothetical protein